MDVAISNLQAKYNVLLISYIPVTQIYLQVFYHSFGSDGLEL